jgi:hypothetical protein
MPGTGDDLVEIIVLGLPTEFTFDFSEEATRPAESPGRRGSSLAGIKYHVT